MKRAQRKKLGAVVACLCLCVAVGSVAWFGIFRGNFAQIRYLLYNGNQAEKAAGTNEEKKSGVDIPAMELPELPEGASADMIGCLVYKGKVYTQAEFFEGDEIEQILPLIGKKLGTAKGTLDEWSSQKEYSQEFASTYNGDVFEVKGYSTDFRLCCIEEYDDGGKFIVFLEHLNGISLSKGEELYGERLRVKGEIRKILYQTHEDWNAGREKYHSLRGITDAQVDSFIDTLYEGEFVDVFQSAPEFYEEYRGDSFDEKYQQAHLYLEMKDNTVIEMRVFGSGYVDYGYMHGWYFVKVPEEAVKSILSACQ